jgi:hypothetical protein
MAATIDEAAVGAMLLSLSRDEQHASIAQFIQHELDEARSHLAVVQQQGSQQAELLRQQGAQQLDVLRQQQQMAAVAATRTQRVEPLKIEVSKYKAVETDNVLRWFVELDDVIEARRITDKHMRVTFALSNLAGRANSWALGFSSTIQIALDRLTSSSPSSSERLSLHGSSSGLELSIST